MTDGQLDDLRRLVLETDRRIVAAVNERLGLVAEIWAIKAERALPVVDEQREQHLRVALAEANNGPLTPAGLEALVDAILELTKAEMARPGSG